MIEEKEMLFLEKVMQGKPERYITLRKPTHPNSNTQGRIREHVYKASLALGRPLKEKEQVHHIDNNSKNNSNTNLVICPDMKYHKLIHVRTKALEESGNANNMKCVYCKEYDNPTNMYVRKVDYQAWHRECSNLYKRNKYIPKNERQDSVLIANS